MKKEKKKLYIRERICLIKSSLKVNKQKLITFVRKPIEAPSVVETGQLGLQDRS